MDLSKPQKINRDTVERALWPLETLLDELAECQTRVDAALAVWSETESTLGPASRKLANVTEQLKEMQTIIAEVWKIGYQQKWRTK